MNRWIITSVVLLSSLTVANGQGRHHGRSLQPGTASRLAEALGDIVALPRETLVLDDLADAVVSRLNHVDRDAIVAMNKRLQDLESDEQNLAEMLRSIEAGDTSVVVDSWGKPPADADAIDEGRLELERSRLLALEAEAARIERERKKRLALARAERRAQDPTPTGKALLAGFERLPEPPTRPVVPVAQTFQSAHPLRLARALFRAGDPVGSVRAWRAADEKEMSPADLYDMARALEQSGELDDAINVLKKLESSATDDFWKKRAKTLSGFITKQKTIDRILKKERTSLGDGKRKG